MVKLNLKIITQSEAKEGSYAEMALNLGVGCTHGCKYCYGPVTVHRYPESFCREMTLKKDIEPRLLSDCKKLKEAGYTGRVLISHVTDPYQPAEVEQKLTRRAIEIMNEHGINYQVLTKGGKLACRDFDLYKARGFIRSYINYSRRRKNRYMGTWSCNTFR